MTTEFSIGFDDGDDDLELDEMQAHVIIEHLRAENNMLFDRAALRLAELKEAQARIAELEAQLVSVSRELVSTDNADRYYRGFNAGFDHATAQGWQPVDDGEYNAGKLLVYVLAGRYVVATKAIHDDNGREYWNATSLPNEYRLCRRTQSAEVA